MTGMELPTLLVLLALAALCSGSEAALFSLGPTERERLKEKGGRSASAVLELLEHPRLLLIVVLGANLGAMTATAATLETVMHHLLPSASLPVAVASSALLLLIFGEVTPQRYAIRHNLGWSLLVARPLRVLFGLARPLAEILAGATAFVSRLKGFGIPEKLTEAEIEGFVGEAVQAGSVSAQERIMIQGVFDLDRRRAADLCVRREKIVAIAKDASLESILAVIRETRLGRFPVHSGSLDNVIGVLYAKDLLPFVHTQKDFSVTKVVRPAMIVPRWKRADLLLRELRRRKVHCAVVVDEFGGIEGWVTLEDVLELLMGGKKR